MATLSTAVPNVANPGTSAPAAPVPTAAAAWHRAWVPLVLLLGAILFLYRETALATATIWARSETFTHGFLVPPIVLWLIWRQRAELARLVPQPSALGLLPLLGASVLWLLGDLAAVNSVAQLALAALLVSAVPAVLGWTVARAMMFALGFLFFAVPLGEFLMPQLMEWTANFTVLALRASGIPVYREGLNFIIPSGSWSVVEACSGVRYLIASLTVGTLFAYLNYRTTKRRWIFVGISILVPVAANWLRAYIIVMLGHLSGNKLAAGVDHLVYGWLFFGVVIMLMFMVGARWAEPAVATKSAPAAAARAPIGKAMAAWPMMVAAALVVALPHAMEWGIARAERQGAVQLTAPAALADGWQARQQPMSGWLPAFQGPSAQTSAAYTREGKAVGLYVGYYRNQDYQRKLVSSDNTLVKAKDPSWEPVRGSLGNVTPGEGLPAMRTAEVRAQTSLLSSGGERLAVWQVYWVNGRFTASDHVAKIYSALYRLLGQGDESAVVIFYATKDQAGSADAVLRSFAAGNLVAIDAWLRQTMAAQ
ncbi:MAG TPA: exosortase A [Burkholderiaceae bacterium]|nr:exosortase A [Burkholderiaceae bacterium]